MARTVIAQISDPHITGPGDELFEGSDPVGNLTKALHHAAQRTKHVVITGDCVARAGTDNEYKGFSDVLAASGVDVALCAGNHDESVKMQTLYSLPSRNGRLDYSFDVSHGRVVVMDSARLGRSDGALDPEQLQWLDTELSSGGPTLIAMHHPCFATGGPALDGVRLDNASIDGLADVVSRHHVLAVVSGHAHMTLSAPFAGTIAYICPSVAYEFGFQGRNLMHRPGHPQYMEYSWGTDGSGFMARLVTVAPDHEWFVMESF
jgi:3',5'-cyclic AMP phosphodiesterase CpdA